METGPADLAARLRACLPDLAPARLEPLGEGDFCRAFAADEQWVIRVAKHAEAARALQREACVLPRIAGALPLPVPRPAYHAHHGCPPFSLHARIFGEELTRETWHALPAARREDAAARVGGFLAALHTLPLDAALSCGVPVDDPASDLPALLAAFRERLAPRLPAEVSARVEARFAAYRAGDVRWSYRPAVLHGDVGPEHVLHDPATGDITGVIDFGDLAVGDPARDFIYVYEDYGTDVLAHVLRHYPLEPPGALIPRIRLFYLAAAVRWTLGLVEEGDADELAEGLAEIAREVTAAPGAVGA